MDATTTRWTDPAEFLRLMQPENPVMFFAPARLDARAAEFRQGFPGLVTYAVKSNPDRRVLSQLIAAGINGFDVASPAEIELLRGLAPTAALHYNNPVRSRAEIAFAVSQKVRSFSVDSASELDKLIDGLDPKLCEISVRFALPVLGASYHFGTKFGATPDLAAILLRRTAEAGFTPSLTFHPGTQCTDMSAWEVYIQTAADIARDAGVRIDRLNVGGGFPADRQVNGPSIGAIFKVIAEQTTNAFGDAAPALVCEPGRALVSDAYSLAVRVKSVRDGEDLFLNDGIYGGLSEQHLVGLTERLEVIRTDGSLLEGEIRARRLFGPTCDSTDMMPGLIPLPAAIDEGDYILCHSLGAYSTATATRFNGYGDLGFAVVDRL